MKLTLTNRVNTPHGEGEIVDFETFDSKRVGVKLDVNPFDYSPAYYFRDQIELI